MKFYCSVLSSDSYLPGLLVTYYSLQKTKPSFPFIALLTNDVSEATIADLNARRIKFKVFAETLSFPEEMMKSNKLGHWNLTLSKLLIFDLIEFEKLVFLDSDLIIFHNIDDLFQYPHLAATNTGGELSGNEDWTALNSGVLVVEPKENESKIILKNMDRLIGLDKFSDQDLIHMYEPEWKDLKEKHISHTYNILVDHIDRYVSELGYNFNTEKVLDERTIKIAHFAVPIKPWNYTSGQLFKLKLRNAVRGRKLYNYCIKAYLDCLASL